MYKSMLASFNGKVMDINEIHISPLDRGYLFGDGVYEVIRIYNYKQWLANEHLERLESSLKKLEIKASVETIKDSITEIFNHSKTRNGYIYIQITRGTAPRSHAFPLDVKPNILIWIDEYDHTPLVPFWMNGISVITHEDLRWARRDIKTINLLGNCLAMEKAKQAGSQEAIMIDKDGFVSEATSNNVFGIKNGLVITTPNSNRILPGITRQYVLKLCKDLDLPVSEKLFKLDELFSFDEIFITGSIMEVMPVVKVDQRIINQGVPGKYTSAIRNLFSKNGGTCL